MYVEMETLQLDPNYTNLSHITAGLWITVCWKGIPETQTPISQIHTILIVQLKQSECWNGAKGP